MRWQVQLLGGFVARCGDTEITRLPTRQATLLLAKLLIEPRTRHSRRELAEWLWRDDRPRRGRADRDPSVLRNKRLRGVLSAVRGLLALPDAPDFIVTTRDHVRLNAEAFDVDVRHFEACVKARDREAAQTCYRGPLLPGLEDDWLDGHRSRLAGLLGRIEGDDLATETGERAPQVLVPYVTRFFDREAETRELVQGLATRRLVAVTGPGGCGKTRLCAVVGERVRGFDAVHFVGLADCTQAAQIVARVGAVLRLPPADAALLDRVVALLGDRSTLLVLDNFEQLAGDEGETVLASMLARLPRLHLLVSTRRALRHPTACNVMLHALPLAETGCSAAQAQLSPAVALFVDRARAARADFHLHARNVRAVLDICSTLDGLPLAIELAASRIRERSVSDIGAELRTSVRMLALRGPRAARAGRHASLEVALDWSWQLLKAPERLALSAVSVFRGGFTEDQADDVVQGTDTEALAALVRDSLVLGQAASEAPGPAGRRLRLLASVREFVAEPERTPPALAAELRRRHRAHFLRMARRAERTRNLVPAADLPNYIAAMESALDDGDATTALALALALQGHFSARGLTPDACAVLCRIEAEAPAEAPDHFALACFLPRLLANAGRVGEARAVAARALVCAAGDPARRAQALVAQAAVVWMADRDVPAVVAAASEALAAARDRALRNVAARAAWLLGAAVLNRGDDPADVDEASRLFEWAQTAFESEGDARGVLLAQAGRTAALIRQRRWEAALELGRAAEAEAQRLQDVTAELQMCSRLSTTLEVLRRFEEALVVCRRQVRLAHANGLGYHLVFGLWNQCHPLARLRRPEPAIRLMAYTARRWVEQFGPLDAGDERYVARVRRLVACQIGQDRLRALWEAGRQLGEREAVELAS